jgi:hypothetical protein
MSIPFPDAKGFCFGVVSLMLFDVSLVDCLPWDQRLPTTVPKGPDILTTIILGCGAWLSVLYFSSTAWGATEWSVKHCSARIAEMRGRV